MKNGTHTSNGEMKNVISLLVDNEPGVLARIAGLISGRGFNIDSLCVAKTNDPVVSRITMVTIGDSHIQEQITKQLNKLVNVIKVVEFTNTEYVDRELVLLKVNAAPENRAEILRIVDIFRCKVVDVAPVSFAIEVTGNQGKLNALIDLLKPIGIIEIARTGVIAMARSKKGVKNE